MNFLCIENIPSSIFLSYPPVRTTGGFLFCRFSVGRAAPRCKSAANVLLLLLVSSAAFCAGIIWNVSLYSTVKRKRKYFAKINTLQSPRCTGGGIAVRGGRAGLSVCTGSIDYFCFRPDGYAGAGCQPERPGRIQRGRAGAAGHCGGSGFYCAAAVVAAARHPAANAGSAHSAARPLEPGVLPGGVLGLANAGNLFGGLLARGLGVTTSSTALPAGGLDLFIRYFSLCVVPAVLEEIYFRGALQGIMRPSGSSVAIFAPALLFALLHLDLAQSITALVCGIFLGWLVERSGSILPGMLLHFINNTLAFLSLYLRQYAPEQLAVVYELILLVALPLAALFLVWRVKVQGFSFSAGLRGGMEPLAVFTSLPYTVCVLFLMGLTVYLYRVG